MLHDAYSHKESLKTILHRAPRQKASAAAMWRRLGSMSLAGTLHEKVSHPTSAAEAALWIAYIGTTASRALPV
jgi:hypothetical protein